jgi:outer membrane biosynthesis protein TonB
MTTPALQADLPWMVSYEEDRRFRFILLQVLLVCLVVGVVAPYIRIPQADFIFEEEVPPRRVRLLTEQPLPEPPPPVIVPDIPEVPVVVPPAPEIAAVQAPVAPVITPRAKAASSGVLALSDALSELRSAMPRTGTTSGRTDRSERVPQRAPQPSVLTADVTRGSKGIDGGVAHQSVLAASGLPDKEEGARGFASGEVALPVTGRLASPSPVAVRSEEEIQEVLDRNKGAMYTLYNRELRRAPSLQGKLVMSITIAPDGRVTRCAIVSSELDSASLEWQLVKLVKGIRFGDKPGVATVTTKIPVEFFPR